MKMVKKQKILLEKMDISNGIESLFLEIKNQRKLEEKKNKRKLKKQKQEKEKIKNKCL